MNGTSFDQEAAQIARHAVLERIGQACRDSARDPASVQLLAVSKTFGFEHVLAMAATGQRAFGENYLQEALDKQRHISGGWPNLKLQWHFIGPIQSNKTKPIAENFDWVHAVEREKIAQRLNSQRPDSMAKLNVCIQVNIDGEATKSGCTPDEVVSLALAIAQMPRLSLRGLMAIPSPSLSDDRQQQRVPFAALAQLQTQVHTALSDRAPAAASALDTLSMGMTADLEAAVAEGSTLVRIGTALFGHRDKIQSKP